MGFFKRKNRFPTEDINRGEVLITNDEIIIKNNSYESDDEIIKFKSIEYIYLETSDYSEPSMFIYQGRQYYIPGDYLGTERLWKHLAERFSFDINIVYSHLKDKKNAIHKLYRTTYTKNYSITSTNTNDYLEGYEIQSPTPLFIPWNTTKEDLLKCPYISSDGFYLDITYPVRIGNIIIDNLGTYINDVRSDVSPQNYYAKCFATDGSDKSLYELKNKIEQDLGSKASYSFNDDSNLLFYAKSNDITLEISYSNDDNDCRTIAYSFSSLHISTKYEYPNLLNDTDYTSKLELSNTFIFKYPLNTPTNYHRDDRIKHTPEIIQKHSKGKSIIWIDNANNILGFADNEYAIWFDRMEIDSLTLWNMLPAKGGGFCNLSINLNTGESVTVFEGEHDTLKHQLEELEKFLTIKVTFYEDYNC